ncbi:MAG: DinB family protein [Candidatus Acidiferrum sp.]
MPISELLLTEFDQEMANTRKALERVPADKWDWKPHPKSGTLGWMASHIATLPNFTTTTIETSELDLGSASSPKVKDAADLVKVFDEQRDIARKAIAGVTDEQLKEIWTLKWDGKVLFALPKYNVLRVMCFNHLIHHRAQLTMYLRALDVPVPALYGPSADEQKF